MKFYSIKEKGFYDDGIHTSMPKDVIELDNYDELLEGLSNGGLEITLDSKGKPVLTERVISSEEKRDSILGEILMIEANQQRALREAALGDTTKLEAIEQEIASLRKKMKRLK